MYSVSYNNNITILILIGLEKHIHTHCDLTINITSFCLVSYLHCFNQQMQSSTNANQLISQIEDSYNLTEK